ncbi:hypothetical protein ASH00_10855 [Arthrobacter sp. Soil782]|uniref:NAD-dependent epimerase/dehydratase family protein n=1 Tax=Arthrobacter sp. Soil782 TaxID=1736410 RepID=UPI0006F59C40|nr:NAD-dependent epimerase/dehydratase family protein [Arthrobacter sp. Soil782]KRF04960.1 hypothetical protein ASH00_10855 [Arthrobacter sp. Soil782]
MTGIHVVVGASGGTGRALVRELVRRGRQVRAINRSGSIPVPEGVEVAAGDATDADRMIELCRRAAVVYNAVNVPFVQWREAFPKAVDGVLAGARAAGAVMVFADDTWMYGRVEGAMREDLPYRPVSDKGVLRAWLAERVLASHSRGEVRTVIARAPELYGPQVESLLARNLFGAAVSRSPAVWVGAMDQPLGPLFIDDFARGMIELGEQEAAYGSVWHIPTPPAITARKFLSILEAESGSRVRMLRVGAGTARALGLVWEVAQEGAEMLYQFHQPHVVDASAYQERFGPVEPTAYEDGIRRTLQWYRQSPRQRLMSLGA